MEQNVDLKKLEKKTFLATATEDGLIDLEIGILIFGMGLGWFTNFLGSPWRSLVFPGLALIAFFAGRHFITTPRIGVVKFSRERQRKRAKIGLVIAAIVAVQALLIVGIVLGWIPPEFKELLGRLALPLGIGAMVALIMAAIAYVLGYRRFYIYGALIGIQIPLVEVLDKILEAPAADVITFTVPATVIIAYSLIRLSKFMKKYPLPEKEA